MCGPWILTEENILHKPIAIFSANRGYALTSSRTLLIQHFLSSGWNVVLVTADDEERRSLCEMGAHLEPAIFNRGGFSPPIIDAPAKTFFLQAVLSFKLKVLSEIK